MLGPGKGRAVVAVAALSLIGGLAVGCGGADQPGSVASPSPSLTVTATTPPPTSKPEPEPGLARAKVVLVREFADGQRALVAYDFVTGTSRRLVDLSRDEDPAVSPDGTQAVLVRANGPLRNPVTNSWMSKSGSRLVLIDLVNGDERMLTPTAYRTKRYSPQWNREDGWVYYLERAGRDPLWLMRVNPETAQAERVPHGRNVASFTIEPDGLHAWVSAAWCSTRPSAPATCEPRAYRLTLATGDVKVHRVQMWQSEVAWTPNGRWIAISQVSTDGSQLSVARWPGDWTGAPRALFEMSAQYPRFFTHFDGVDWQPDAASVVIGIKRVDMRESQAVYDRWSVSLVDRRTGERTDITPQGAADTSFDVWWPEG
jgi:hypothetical protein